MVGWAVGEAVGDADSVADTDSDVVGVMDAHWPRSTSNCALGLTDALGDRAVLFPRHVWRRTARMATATARARPRDVLRPVGSTQQARAHNCSASVETGDSQIRALRGGVRFASRPLGSSSPLPASDSQRDTMASQHQAPVRKGDYQGQVGAWARAAGDVCGRDVFLRWLIFQTQRSGGCAGSWPSPGAQAGNPVRVGVWSAWRDVAHGATAGRGRRRNHDRQDACLHTTSSITPPHVGCGAVGAPVPCGR